MMRYLIPLSQKGRLEDLGKMGEASLYLTNSPQVGLDIPRRDVPPPPVSESGDQDGGPNVSPMKKTKIMARRGRKTKVSGSRNKTPKKTPNGKQHKSQAKEDTSLTCDEDFDDLFIHTPNGKQPMSQAKEDVQEQENDNEVKVNERVTLKELLMSGYTHADAMAAMKELCVVTLFLAFIL
ncbi:unnamed protein product [Lactuca virosa]|uniref:UBA domain-containing protein n=1 Tax=Lactuca virosa TaxID=75947 RepID=A0AAU9MK87_9ASTR|nr:unnamed protein product [Lactuca virosa]